MSVVLCFAGAMRSGKSTVTQRLAAELGWPRAAFGDYVRTEAQRRGLAGQREQLQRLGGTLIDELGWREFSLATLQHAGVRPGEAPVLIDGVRHEEALFALRDLYPGHEIVLVLLRPAEHARRQRMALEGVEATRLERLEAHSTERQVRDRLPARADFVVDADSVEDAVEKVRRWLDEPRGV